MNLMLETGAASIAEIAVFALSDLEHFLQQVQAFPHGASAGIRSEKYAFLAFTSTSLIVDAGKLIFC